MKRLFIACIGLILLTGCSLPASTPPPPTETATVPPAPSATSTFISTASPTDTPVSFTAVPTLTHTLTPPPVPTSFCNATQAVAVIDSLKNSMLNSDGVLLSSLVHPTRGMDARLFRDGRVVNYTAAKAQFLFETDFVVNWGAEPGSGLEKSGAFHDVIVPDLVEIFNKPYTLHCNELKYGGATYQPEFPYDGNFYSVYFAGSDEFGFLDWHTWVIGIDYSNNKPYIFAILQFFWEP